MAPDMPGAVRELGAALAEGLAAIESIVFSGH
jgi:hypothetical protein